MRKKTVPFVIASCVLTGILLWEVTALGLITWENWLPFLGLGGVAAIALVVLWKVPQWQVRFVTGIEPKERFDRINEARKTLAQIIGGIVLLAGFYSTMKNIAVTQEGQITDRFTKAIAQLGDTKLEVRLGGIYALERIANESRRDHWPIIEVLTAYVREHAPQQSPKDQQPSVSPLSADIQAILTVIGRRNLKYERPGQTVNLRRTVIGAANLRGTNFSHADLTSTDLDGADLGGANLNGADLISADLHTAFLALANITRADLHQAVLRGANLSGADLRGADLTGADLNGADLAGAELLECRNLNQGQIDQARGDARTQLPPHLQRPKTWE